MIIVPVTWPMLTVQMAPLLHQGIVVSCQLKIDSQSRLWGGMTHLSQHVCCSISASTIAHLNTKRSTPLVHIAACYQDKGMHVLSILEGRLMKSNLVFFAQYCIHSSVGMHTWNTQPFPGIVPLLPGFGYLYLAWGTDHKPNIIWIVR